jgi:F0F1-type ATP synthase alpha subunit
MAVTFDKIYCDKILKTLEKYLKKTFAEYQNNITYHEFSLTLLTMTKEKYDRCKSFMTFFKRYEDKPLEKLGNIFRKCGDFCSIQ